MATKASSAVALAFNNKILERSAALGNSKRGLKEVASDLCNQVARNDKKAIRELCDGTFLCRSTLERVMNCEDGYRPQADTLERIFRHFNAEIVFNEVIIKGRYRNKPKDEA